MQGQVFFFIFISRNLGNTMCSLETEGQGTFGDCDVHIVEVGANISL